MKKGFSLLIALMAVAIIAFACEGKSGSTQTKAGTESCCDKDATKTSCDGQKGDGCTSEGTKACGQKKEGGCSEGKDAGCKDHKEGEACNKTKEQCEQAKKDGTCCEMTGKKEKGSCEKNK